MGLPIWIPPPIRTSSLVGTTFNDAADRVATMFKILRTGTIDRIAVGIGTVTTAAALDLRLETVGAADGLPTGTLWATNTTGTTGSPTSNSIQEATLTASASVTRGDVLAVVAQPNTTPINLSVNLHNGDAVDGNSWPTSASNTSGTYVKAANPAMIAVRYSDGVWDFVGQSMPLITSFATTNAFSTSTSATTGTRRGLKFTLPFAATLKGCWVRMANFASTSSDFTIELYNTSGTLLSTLATIEGSYRVAASNQNVQYLSDADYSLSKDTAYRLVLVPNSTNSITLTEQVTSSAAYFDTQPGGDDFHLTKYVSSAWSDVTTERPVMGVIVEVVTSAGETSHVFIG